jgi:hypothetical protein
MKLTNLQKKLLALIDKDNLVTTSEIDTIHLYEIVDVLMNQYENNQ